MKDGVKVTIYEPERVKKDFSVGIYARVSTKSKEQMDSLANQLSGLTRLAAAHYTWFVADIFVDVGSAKTGSSRTEFERMIQECERKKIDIVLTKSVSRFGRDTVETIETVRRLKNAGTRVIFEREKIDSETLKSELELSARSAFDQAENEWRSENILLGLKYRAENGTSGLFDRPCYGLYKDRHGMLAIDEEKANVVRQIYKWYLEGESVIKIKRRLEASGVKTSTGKDNWSKRTIEKILVNMKYTGDVAIAYSGDLSKKMMYGNHHTGIISKEMYEAVQMEMAARSNVEKTEEGTRRKKTKYSSKKKKKAGE